MVFELIYGFCLSLNLNWSGPAWTKRAQQYILAKKKIMKIIA